MTADNVNNNVVNFPIHNQWPYYWNDYCSSFWQVVWQSYGLNLNDCLALDRIHTQSYVRGDRLNVLLRLPDLDINIHVQGPKPVSGQD